MFWFLSFDWRQDMDNDDVSLLEEKLVKLLVKSSKLVPSGVATLLYTVWTKKT